MPSQCNDYNVMITLKMNYIQNKLLMIKICDICACYIDYTDNASINDELQLQRNLLNYTGTVLNYTSQAHCGPCNFVDHAICAANIIRSFEWSYSICPIACQSAHSQTKFIQV